VVRAKRHPLRSTLCLGEGRSTKSHDAQDQTIAQRVSATVSAGWWEGGLRRLGLYAGGGGRSVLWRDCVFGLSQRTSGRSLVRMALGEQQEPVYRLI